MRTLRVPYTGLCMSTRALCAVNEWLRVPITALRAPYTHLPRAFRAVYEWLRVPTTANHSLTRTLRAPYVQFMNG